MTFEEDCRRTVAAIEARDVADRDIVTTGAKMLVIRTHRTVYRFPRFVEEASTITELAERSRVARRLGLLAPEVYHVHEGAVGNAHMAIARVSGREQRDLVGTVDGRDLYRLCDSLTEYLHRVAAVPVDAWTFAQPDWRTTWAALPGRLNQAVGEQAQDRWDWQQAADAAARTAANCPLALMHGDIGGVNVMFDARMLITAVLDWDGAIIGDPANDVAAVLHHMPARARSRMLADPELAAAAQRFSVYQATWPAQAALWELENPSGNT